MLVWQIAERTKGVGRKGTEIPVSGSTVTFLGGFESSQGENQQFSLQFRRLHNPRKLVRKFVARSGLTVRVHLRRSSACPARLLMLTHPRSLRLRGLHQHSSESWIQYKKLTKLWSMRKCFHKGSSQSSGISAQQRGQPASELRGSGQGRRRCKLECLLGREQENKRTPRNNRSQSSFRGEMLYAGAQAPEKARSRLAQMVFNTATARQDAENAERLSGYLVSANLWLALRLHWVRGWFNDQPKLPPWDSVYGRVP